MEEQEKNLRSKRNLAIGGTMYSDRDVDFLLGVITTLRTERDKYRDALHDKCHCIYLSSGEKCWCCEVLAEGD